MHRDGVYIESAEAYGVLHAHQRASELHKLQHAREYIPV